VIRVKYTGRLVASSLDLIFILFYVLSYYITYGKIQSFELIGDTFSLALTWWCGKQYDKAKYFAERDVLTEAYNRRFALNRFKKWIGQRKGKLSVLMIDVDNFKSINDTHGHLMGDKVLKLIASILCQHTRKCDIVARWGGDEFLIIAPNIDEQASQNLSRRIEKGLQEVTKKLPITVTVSVGGATYPTYAKDLDGLIKVADRSMYKYKKERFENIPLKKVQPIH
jgi:diguanylate cyclase (GGDEF)-like protein